LVLSTDFSVQLKVLVSKLAQQKQVKKWSQPESTSDR